MISDRPLALERALEVVNEFGDILISGRVINNTSSQGGQHSLLHAFGLRMEVVCMIPAQSQCLIWQPYGLQGRTSRPWGRVPSHNPHRRS